MHKVISIITPCFNDEQSVRECYEVVRDVFATQLPGYRREHIFCDNASTDQTVEILKEIAADDDEVKIIINSRNFGILRNTYNGVLNASGDAIFLFMPVDLQDPPSLIPEFVGLWEQGYEIVYGIRAKRQEPFLLRNIRKAYYRILSLFSYVDYPPDVGDFQLIDRKVLNAIKQYSEFQPFLRMLTFDCGFRAVGVPYTWQARKHGVSRNRFVDMVDQGLIGLVSFSNLPLRFALYAGISISLLSLLYAMFVVILRLTLGEYAPRGTFTILAAIFFFGGVQLMFLGVIGEYILMIATQVRRRPMVIERERINFDEYDESKPKN